METLGMALARLAAEWGSSAPGFRLELRGNLEKQPIPGQAHAVLYPGSGALRA